MDAYDLFRKLGSGAKFDFKRFRSDAEKLQVSALWLLFTDVYFNVQWFLFIDVMCPVFAIYGDQSDIFLYKCKRWFNFSVELYILLDISKTNSHWYYKCSMTCHVFFSTAFMSVKLLQRYIVAIVHLLLYIHQF